MTNVIVSNQYLTDRIETYHTQECVTVRHMQGSREIEKSEAEAAGLRECSHCTGEHPANDKCDKSIYMAAKRVGERNATVTVSTTTHGCMPTTYHTTECPTVKRINGKREISKAEAEARGLKLCKRCDPEHNPGTGSKNFDYYYAALNHD